MRRGEKRRGDTRGEERSGEERIDEERRGESRGVERRGEELTQSILCRPLHFLVCASSGPRHLHSLPRRETKLLHKALYVYNIYIYIIYIYIFI